MKRILILLGVLAVLALSAAVAAVAMPGAPVNRHKDGTVTIDTRTLKAADGCFGPTPLLIHLDVKQQVSRIEALPNDETPQYFRLAADKLLHAWDGVPARKVKDVKVDAVSGATYSSEGVISNVQAGIDYYLETLAK